METSISRLILVEGLTGSGKSTLAHFIGRQLQYNGVEAAWLHEGEDPNPLWVEFNGDIEDHMEEIQRVWSAWLAKMKDSHRAMVLEAYFINNLMESLMTHNVERPRILAFATALQEEMAPLNPALVYLDPGDVATALERNFQNRGERFKNFVIQSSTETPYAISRRLAGYEGMLAFWQDFVRLADALFDSWPYAKLMLHSGEGRWEENNRRVLDFLSLIPFAESSATSQEAAGWVGLYQDKDSGREFLVDYQDGALFINTMQKARSRLLRISRDVFLVEGWHFEVAFSPDGSFLTIGGRDVDYLRLVGIRAEKAA